MPQGMRGGGLGYAGALGGLFYGALQQTLMHVMPAYDAGPWIGRYVGCGKHVLPGPFARRIGVLTFEGLRKPHLAEAVAQVSLMDGADSLQVCAQRLHDALGEHGDSVFGAFTISNDDLAVAEIEILHAKTQAIHQPKACSVEQGGHQRERRLQLREKAGNFLTSENYRQFPWPLRPGKLAEIPELDFEDLLVEEYNGIKRLILGRRSDFAFHSQMAQECVDFGGPHLIRMSLTVEENESPNPLQVGFFRPQAVVFDSKDLPHLLEKLRLRSSHS